jgi:hypothetical protein
VTETDNYTSLHLKVESWKVNVVCGRVAVRSNLQGTQGVLLIYMADRLEV